MAFTLKDLDPDARALLAHALFGRQVETRKSADKIRARALTPKLPTAAEKGLEAFMVRLSRRMSREIAKGLEEDLGKARLREDANLEDLFSERTFGDVSLRLSKILEDPEVLAILDQFGRKINAANGREIERVIGINPMEIDPDITRALIAFRQQSADLISSIAQDQLGQVRDLVNTAANTGIRVETLAKQIGERYEVSESRARLIARDQTLKANANLTRVRHERLGIRTYRWSTSSDSRVRPHHRRLEDSIQEWGSPPVTNPAGDHNHPGEDYQCRCVAIPILDE